MEEILNILHHIFINVPDGVNLGIAPMVAGALISGAGKLIGGIFGAGRARRAQRRAASERRKLTGELNSLEKSRQAVINPYSNFKDLSSLAKDLSGKLSNPYANLGLANTLDTLRATGASAGGATALAQAALQSKKGVAASIEQQEAANEKLRAQGEQYLQQAEIAEQRRLQGVQISEGQRVQQADAAGRSFMFNALERRQDDKINYTRGQLQSSKNRENAAYNQKTQAITGAITGAFGAAGDVASAGGFFKGGALAAKAAGYNLAGS